MALGHASRKLWPLGWLAWATALALRLGVFTASMALAFAALTAWEGGRPAVNEVDWVGNALDAAPLVLFAFPMLLLLDFPKQLERRRRLLDGS